MSSSGLNAEPSLLVLRMTEGPFVDSTTRIFSRVKFSEPTCYKLLLLLTLLPLLNLFSLFKQHWSKKAIMPIHNKCVWSVYGLWIVNTPTTRGAAVLIRRQIVWVGRSSSQCVTSGTAHRVLSVATENFELRPREQLWVFRSFLNFPYQRGRRNPSWFRPWSSLLPGDLSASVEGAVT